MKVIDIYGAMAERYLHGKTTTLFREVQSDQIRTFLAKARGTAEGKWYSEMSYLIVGPGPAGNVEEWINQSILCGPYLDEVNPVNITYLDNSPVVLELCKKFVRGEVRKRVGKEGCGNFVLGSGEELGQHFSPNTFDVVIAALCDHLQIETFFREAHLVLKPGGALITSLPADGINRVVRERIYQIPPDYTRFNIEGLPHLVPSRLMTTEALRELYRQQQFVSADAVEVSAGSIPASETIKQAAAMTGSDHQQTPLIVVGYGIKF